MCFKFIIYLYVNGKSWDPFLLHVDLSTLFTNNLKPWKRARDLVRNRQRVVIVSNRGTETGPFLKVSITGLWRMFWSQSLPCLKSIYSTAYSKSFQLTWALTASLTLLKIYIQSDSTCKTFDVIFTEMSKVFLALCPLRVALEKFHSNYAQLTHNFPKTNERLVNEVRKRKIIDFKLKITYYDFLYKSAWLFSMFLFFPSCSFSSHLATRSLIQIFLSELFFAESRSMQASRCGVRERASEWDSCGEQM